MTVSLASEDGRHIPGTPDTYRHGWKPISAGTDDAVRASNVARAKTGVVKRAQRQRGSIGGGFAVAGGSSDITRPIADALTQAARTGKDRYVIPTALGMQASDHKMTNTAGYIHVKPNGDVIDMRRDNAMSPVKPVARMSDHAVAGILSQHLSKTRTASPAGPAAPRPKAKTVSDKQPRSVVARLVKDMKANPSLLTPAYKQRARDVAAASGASDLIPADWARDDDAVELARVTPVAAGKKTPPGRPAAAPARGRATVAGPQVRAGTGTAPAKTAGARGAKPVPPPAAPAVPPAFRRAKHTPLTPMRQAAAKSMSKLADHIAADHPDLIVHQHVRDAARTLRAGQEEAAQRHLRAAMFSLTPQSLMRNGHHTDDAHAAARAAMHGVHRHLLLVKDIADVKEKNQEAISRASYGDDTSAPPGHADPGSGYGPGALAAKPTTRQPGGDQALNAPPRTNSGGSDPNVADPAGPQPRGSKQFTYGWGDLDAVIEMAFHFNPGQPRNHHGEWSRIMGAFQGDPAAGFERQKSANRSAESDFMSANPGWRQRRDALPTAERNSYQYNVEGGMHPAAAVQRAEQDQRDAQREQDKLDAYHKDQARMPKSSRRSQLNQEMDDGRGSGPTANEADSYDSGGMDELANSGGDIPVELAYNPGQPRDHQGMWTRLAGAVDRALDTAAKSDIAKGEAGWKLDLARHMAGAHPGIEQTEHAHAADHASGAVQTHAHPMSALASMGLTPERAAADRAAYVAIGRQDAKRNIGIAAAQAQVQMDYAAGTQAAVQLSAQTGRLAVTPAPYGKPGGPGLYHVKGLKHSDYLEQIVKALMSKRGMDKGRATAIARGSIRKWMRGGGHVHPEVRAAAGAAEAEELKAQAQAHAHAATWDEVAAVVELAWGNAWKTEARGKEGEWTGSLSGLADKLDGDHPGKGFGDEVRKAKDAAAAGDRDKAGEHLENAYGAVRGRAGEVGSKTAEGRKAAGNAFLLDQKMRQLQGGVTLARTWGDVVIELHYSQDEPRNRHGEWAGIPGNMRGTPSMKMAQRAGLIKALGASQSADRSDKKRKLSMALHMKLADAAHARGDFTAEADHREQARQLATAGLAWDDVRAIELSWKDAYLHEKRGKGGEWTSGDAEKIIGAIGKANDRRSGDTDTRGDAGRDWSLGKANANVRQGNFSQAADWVGKMADRHPDPGSAAQLRVIAGKLRASAGNVTPAPPRQRVAPPTVQRFAYDWHDVARVIELAVAAGQARVPAGQAGGGRFGSGGGAGTGPKGQPAQQPAQQQQPGAKSIASQTASKSARATIAKNQQQKQALLQQAAGYGQKINALEAQRKTLQQELASASGQTSSGQSGSTTSSGSSTTSSGASTTSSGSSTTASSAPSTSSSSTSSPSPASSAGTTPSTAGTPAQAGSTTSSGASTTSSGASTTPSGASTTGSSAASAAASSTQTLGQITAQITAMNTQITQFQKLYAQTMAQAAKY